MTILRKPLPKKIVVKKKVVKKPVVKKKTIVTKTTAQKPGVVGGTQPLTTPTVPTLAVNSNGQLDLPFDYKFSQDAKNKAEETNNNLLDIQGQQQTQAASYLKNMRDTEQGYGEQKKTSLNTAAGGGNLFSSAYGSQIGKDVTGYNNTVNDLNTQNTNANNQFTAQKNNAVAGLNNYLRDSATTYGANSDAKAGTLGYGVAAAKSPTYSPGAKKVITTKKVVKVKAKPKPKVIVKKVIKKPVIKKPVIKKPVYALPRTGA